MTKDHGINLLISSLKPVKKNSSIFFIIFLAGAGMLITTCTKDDDPEIRKAAITGHLINEINPDSLESYVMWMEEMGTRFSLSENHRQVALNIRNKFKAVGYANARIDSFLISKTYRNVIYNLWQYNVSASLKGNLYPDSVCVIGGHYDDHLLTGDPFSIAPGANDNASGVAAVLEIARIMKTNRYSPLNTIEFIAFGAEEIGLLGSIDYVTYARQHSKSVKLMLNNDMIAYQPDPDVQNWRVNLIDYDNSHGARVKAEELCSRYTILNYYNDNTHNKQSDSYPFFVAGYKALFFTSDIFDPNYHTLYDLSGKCNFDYCSEIVKLCCAILVYNN
jgi:hypothetical protein